MTCACPHCGAPMPDVPLEAMLSACTPGQRRILDLVARRPGLSGNEVADVVYQDDPDGGPLYARGTIAVQVKNLNKRILPLGWRVEGRAGFHGYRLERLPG